MIYEDYTNTFKGRTVIVVTGLSAKFDLAEEKRKQRAEFTQWVVTTANKLGANGRVIESFAIKPLNKTDFEFKARVRVIGGALQMKIHGAINEFNARFDGAKWGAARRLLDERKLDDETLKEIERMIVAGEYAENTAENLLEMTELRKLIKRLLIVPENERVMVRMS